MNDVISKELADVLYKLTIAHIKMSMTLHWKASFNWMPLLIEENIHLLLRQKYVLNKHRVNWVNVEFILPKQCKSHTCRIKASVGMRRCDVKNNTADRMAHDQTIWMYRKNTGAGHSLDKISWYWYKGIFAHNWLNELIRQYFLNVKWKDKALHLTIVRCELWWQA